MTFPWLNGTAQTLHGLPAIITQSLFLKQRDDLLPSLRTFDEPEIDPNAAVMFSPSPEPFAAG